MGAKQYLALALALGCAGNAFAATSTSIEITGKAIPAVCNITTSQAKLDLGEVLADATGKVAAISRSLGTLNFNCSAATPLSLSLTSTAPAGSSKNYSSGWHQAGTNLANARVVPTKTMVNSESGTLINGLNGVWTGMNAGQAITLAGGDYTISFAKTGTLVPLGITTASIDLDFKLDEILKADFAKGDISANQTLTFEIKYI
ncbi:hypothetical protein LZ838_03470 [Pseudomonas sp. AA27]|uniref:hypothetical protein n=1 Tax=unclassified Pseudomonas TaxID=196821 RepID=UPI001942A2AE|nr:MULTISPECIES: hypothetical protein [unclassified Pseudomonas]MCF1486421.1 hypothetical protein [Pseudomonas sp. AA27]BCJ06161.1 hypothetical protein PRtIB026_A40610 [Pseudomonas sp. RtIB026]